MPKPKLILTRAGDGATVAAFENRPETIACDTRESDAIARARCRLALAEERRRLRRSDG